MTSSENNEVSGETIQKEYGQSQNKNTSRTKISAVAGEWNVQKNMTFFIQIIKSLRLTYKKLSDLTGVSQQLISWWITTDDCKLSNIISIFEKLNMKIECSYSPLPESKQIFSSEKYSIEIGDIPSLRTVVTIEKSPVIDEVLKHGGKLKFLAEFINELGIGLAPFCRMIDHQYFTVYQWFKKDEIKIAKINYIADRMHQKVNWKLTALKKDESE